MSAATPLTLEQVIERTANIEDKVRAVATAADKDIRSFQARHALPSSIAKWTVAFSRRLRFRNKKVRHDTKQRLNDDAQHLGVLYADPETGRDSFQCLQDLVSETTNNCKQSCKLFNDVQELYDARSSAGSVHAHNEPLARRSLIRIARFVEELHMNEVTIRSDFNEWEACFLALCTSEHMPSLKKALHDSKLHKADIMAQCTPLFNELVSVGAKRDSVLAKLDFAAILHSVQWFKMLRFDTSPLAEELVQYDALEGELAGIRTEQSVILDALETLARSAETVPLTLATAAGTEIAVERLFATVLEYEKLSSRCHNILQVAHQVVIDLQGVARAL